MFVFPAEFSDRSAGKLNWKFKKEKEGIKVYTRDIEGSNLKELKLTMSFKKTTIKSILKLLDTAELYRDWVFKCSDSKMAEKLSDLESIAYYKFDFPWPLSDRDAYMRSVVRKDHHSGKTIITTTSVPDFKQEEEDVVRIINHYNRWEFEETSDHVIHLTYYLKTDPAGKIPDWLVNLAVDRGPTTSLSNFRKLLSN